LATYGVLQIECEKRGMILPSYPWFTHRIRHRATAKTAEIRDARFEPQRSEATLAASGTQAHGDRPWDVVHIDHTLCDLELVDEDSGIVSLADIPTDLRLTDNQTIQRRAAISGQPHIDRPAIAAFLSQLEYPLQFLDFETFGTAIPLFDGVKPYQQVPFQFSLHVVRSPGAAPEHFSFLAEGRGDPRPEFMRQLKTVVSSSGSVVVYNASFEKGRLDECCDLLPEYRSWYRQVERRIVDLLLPFRGFRYYHPAQCGSASMKAVLPALTGRGYEGLEIQEGGTASLEFLRVTYADVAPKERQRVRKQLEEYCGLDTEGMVWIVDTLRKLAD
jgi:hypothetical protein